MRPAFHALPGILCVVAATLAMEGRAHAQAADPAVATPAAKVKSVLDDQPVMSARGAALGGALSTVADDIDAAFANPAGIGGLDWGKKDPPFVRKLFFPWFGVAANQSSRDLGKEVRATGATKDSTIGKALLDANSGDRQYARAALVGGVVLGRTIVVPFSDLQVAATGEGNGSNLVDLRYRSTTGIGAGTSVQDPEGRLSLGYFGYRAQRNETTGAFQYDELIDKTARAQAIKDHSTKSAATGHNAGLIWRLGKTASPTLGLAVKDIGGTKYRASDGALVATVPQDLTTGFSVTPMLGKWGHLNLLIEAGHLQDSDLSVAKKFRSGVELLVDGFGSYATLGLRGGYNSAGGSGGLALNLGLLSFEAALQSVDIGAGNEKVIERRVVGIFYVNVAAF